VTVRRIKLRRGTPLEWQNSNPALNQGEVGIELGSVIRMKAGDGFTSWNDLAYIDDAGLDILRQEYGDEVTFELGLATTLN
jgi:hypothetical protein